MSITFDNIIVIVLTVVAITGLIFLNRAGKKAAKTNTEQK